MDVKPISLCDYLLSYKQFLLVIHYILDCSTKQKLLCSLSGSTQTPPVSLRSFPSRPSHYKSCILAPENIVHTSPRILSPFHRRSLGWGGGLGGGRGW